VVEEKSQGMKKKLPPNPKCLRIESSQIMLSSRKGEKNMEEERGEKKQNTHKKQKKTHKRKGKEKNRETTTHNPHKATGGGLFLGGIVSRREGHGSISSA